MTQEPTSTARHTRLHAGGIHVFELQPILHALQETDEYRKSGRTGTTLVKAAEQRVVLEALRHGATLATHHAPGPATVQVVAGEIRLEAREEILYLRAGQVLYLPTGTPHSVEAMKDSALLITISPH